MRIAILGAGGQLARDLVGALAEHDLLPLTHEEVDILDSEGLESRLGRFKPRWVINSAAYNLVDQAESEPAPAFRVNALGARCVAKVCSKIEVALAHLSTDYVFGLDADRSTPWLESDAPGPVSVYGTSKLAGEFFVRAESDRNLVIRTCGLYGIHGSRGKGGNFVETMLRLADSGKPVKVVNDQTCTPSYTYDVSAAIAKLVERGAQGTVHVTNAGQATWFELAREAFRLTNKTVDLAPITTAQFGAKARRPCYSVLGDQGLRRVGIDPCPPWQDALARYLEARSNRKPPT